MTDNYPNLNAKHVRQSIIFVVDWQWSSLRSKIIDLKSELSPFLNSTGKALLENSYSTFEDTLLSLVNDNDYIETENDPDLRKYVVNLTSAMKDFFEAFATQQDPKSMNMTSVDEGRDSVFSSMITMYRNLESSHSVRLFMVYPAITQVLTYLRNTVTHTSSRETSHRVRLQPLNNIYSLSCIMILAMYAYNELLDLWLETCKKHGNKN